MTDPDVLASVAAQLAARVRDDDPEANARWLMAMLPDSADRFALLFVLAAAVDADRPWAELVAWTDELCPQVGPQPAYRALLNERYAPGRTA